jgi:hypothetical protein
LNASFGPLVGNSSQFAFVDDALLVAILKLLNKHVPLFPGLLIATFIYVNTAIKLYSSPYAKKKLSLK